MQIEIDPEQDFHVVIDGVAKALSLDALDDAYQADSISEETLIWQEGLDEWMRLDALLAILGQQEEAPAAPTPPIDENTYSVMVAPEEIKTMTLDALADAHRLGVVNEETLVWQAGYTEWVPLSVVIAGIAHEHVSLAPSLAPTQQSAHQPSTVAAPVAAVAPAPSIAPSPLDSLAPTAASIGPMSHGVGLAPSTDSLLEDLEFPPPTGSGSPWVKRSMIGLGSLAFLFVIYQGTSDSSGEEAAQLDGVAAKGVSAAAAPEEEAEPSAWEKEKAMMAKARLADEASAKDGSSASDAFGARLAGKSEPKKDAPARAKRKWRPKAKKASASSNSQYDPMNGAL